MVTDRPNMLVVVQDQLRYDLVRDATPCQTPAQDRLQSEGAWFTGHYTPLAICSPARASVLTGTYPHTNGVLNNLNGTDAVVQQMPKDLPTVAHLVHDAGYRTGYIGKWHLGRGHGPENYGFDVVRASDTDLVDNPRFAPYWQMAQDPEHGAIRTRYPEPGPRHGEQYQRRPFPLYGTAEVDEEMHPARAVTDAAIDTLGELAAGDDPFLLVVSFIEPHWPYVLPEPWASMYRPEDVKPWPNFHDTFEGKPRTLEAGLEHFGVADFTWEDWAPIVALSFGSVSFIDDLVGRILAEVDSLGVTENTVVINTTDHGDMDGGHRQFNKGPLMYEETYHVPFQLRWPGVVDSGTTIDALTSHIDVAPTLCDIAQIPTPDHVQGASLLPLLGGQSDGWREDLVCEFHGDEFGLYSQRMLRHDRWKLVYNPNDVRELYDLEADPWELTNLAYDEAHADLRRDLEARLYAQMNANGDPLRMWAVNTLG